MASSPSKGGTTPRHDDVTRGTPLKRRRLLPLVDLRGSTGMAGSNVEMGAHSISGASSVGIGRRSRTPLTDLDAKFVTSAKSGLCVSGDGGGGDGGRLSIGGSVRISHKCGTGTVLGLGSGGASSGLSLDEGATRFPRLDQCAHFHYEYVELPPIVVSLVTDDLKSLSSAGGGTGDDCENRSILVQVTSLGRSWVLRRTYDNFRFLDRQLHRCCYDRKYSHLPELPQEENLPGLDKEAAVEGLVGEYVARLSEVAGSLITCGPVLNWLELDNRGHRLIVTDDSDINTPAVAAAYVVKRYMAQATDEISFEVGDMISVIDMPPPEESIWWRGKRGFQVGFFPCECVQVIGDKVPQTMTLPPARASISPQTGVLSHQAPNSGSNNSTLAPTKPVLRKHGKLIAFFRSFILSRPSRRKLKQSGILRERVFGCDLGEHLLNSGHEIPMVLRCCAEFIESHGIVDGIYRLSGITSNIQKLRNAFDEDRIPDLYGDESITQDIHCVSSVLKMYFRELPNPLLTYQLYEKFVSAVMQDDDRLLFVRDVVQQLPPPHYRTLEYLVHHLSKVASHSAETGMTPKNIAIVWAPNLLRSKDLDMGGVAALQDVGTQAVVTEYLVRYVDLIFNDKIPLLTHATNGIEGTPKKSRPKSLAISTPTKLISIEEARSRALNTAIKPDQRYIEVGGGPQNLPKTYHTVIDLPSRKGGSLKQKKSPLGWKSIFGKGKSVHKHHRKASTPCEINLNTSDSAVKDIQLLPSTSKRLRPVKSVESLVSTPASLKSNKNSQIFEHSDRQSSQERDSRDRMLQREGSGSRGSGSSDYPSPRIQSPRTHNRSISHDSYFSLLDQNLNSEHPEGLKEEDISDSELSPESSKMFLEPELKVFSEDDTYKSTSMEDTHSRCTLDLENMSMGSGCVKSKDEMVLRPEKTSLKDKFKRFTSPSSQRKGGDMATVSDSGEDSRNNSLKRASTAIKEKIAHALSPETSRKRTENMTSKSPSNSPKTKHVRMVDEPLILDGSYEEKSEIASFDSFLESRNWICSKDKTLAEVHLEPDCECDIPKIDKDSDDDASHQSIESALIEPELLEKITRLRASPSIANNSIASDVSDFEENSKELPKETNNEVVKLPPVPLATAELSDITLNFDKKELLSTSMEDCGKYGLNVSQENKRPTSLLVPSNTSTNTLGLPVSPDTPQGDSTFLEIQYHPLSDTTEPSTPSESQFVSDLVANMNDPLKPLHSRDNPLHSSPLSPDLSSTSSADEPLEGNGPYYENVEHSSIIPLTRESVGSDDNNDYTEPKETTISSLMTSPDLDDNDTVGADEYENYEYDAEYENVTYGTEYENVTFSSDRNVCYEDGNKIDIDESSYENVSLPVKDAQKHSAHSDEGCYENVSGSADLESDCCTDTYEEVTFNNSNNIPESEELDVKTNTEIEGEIVYQQVKFLRKSIQEVNDILKKDDNELDEIDTKLSNSCNANLSNCKAELPSNVPQDTVRENENNLSLIDEGGECLDSPVTPSSSSMVTEVLVLPSFSSPTESNADDTTSPDASDTIASPRLVPVIATTNANHGLPKSPGFSGFSPPSPDPNKKPADPSESRSQYQESDISAPSPWPRLTPTTTTLAPVPKPRNLPKLNLQSPLDSPTFSSSSTSISPDSAATAGTPTPTEEYEPLPSSASLDSTSPSLAERPILSATPTESPNSTEQVSPEFEIGLNRDINMCSFDPKDLHQTKILHRFKSSPDFRDKIPVGHLTTETTGVTRSQSSSGKIKGDIKGEEDDSSKRERIEKYKEERRSYLREKFKSESFRGEKDEMLLRLKQKATSPSRPDDEEFDSSLNSNGASSPIRMFEDKEITEKSETSINEAENKCVVKVNANKFKVSDANAQSVSQGGAWQPAVNQSVSNKFSPTADKPPILRRLNSQDNVYVKSLPQSSLEHKIGIGRNPSPTFSEGNKLISSNIALNPFKSVSPTEHSSIVKSTKTPRNDEIDEDVNVKEKVAKWNTPPVKPTRQIMPKITTPPSKKKHSKDNEHLKENVNIIKPSVQSVNQSRGHTPGGVLPQQSPPKNGKAVKDIRKLSTNSKSDFRKKDIISTVPKISPPPSKSARKTSTPELHTHTSPTYPDRRVSCTGPRSEVRSPGAPESLSPSAQTTQGFTPLNMCRASSMGSQGRIKDMAAIFERESPTAPSKPFILVRQTSKEEKKNVLTK